MNGYAASEWERALRSLESVRQLRETDPDSSASRAYYAAFHAVSALFAQRNQEFTKHSAVRAAVHRDLVNRGDWSADLGKDYDYLMDLRETGDYGGLRHVTPEDATSALRAAQRIVEAVRSSLPAS